jgi:glutamine amidotransferase
VRVAIINYGMGNIASVEKAINFLGYETIVTDSQSIIENSSCIVLPGVGAFAQGMQNLSKAGLIDILNDQVLIKKKPFLGICLGMQLLANIGYEPIETAGLGWIDAEVVRLDEPDKYVPHLGWNNVTVKDGSFMANFDQNDFYFIHSYHMKSFNPEYIASTVNYGKDYVASIQKDNIFATQFHPEKSQTKGLELLKSFFDSYVKN